MPLTLARGQCDEARKLVAAGTDPSKARKSAKADRAVQREAQALADAGMPGPGTFEHAAREWHAYMAASWSTGHAVKVLALLTNDLFPCIGPRLLAELTAPELLTPARRVEARGATESAYRALKAAGAGFRFGVQQGYCESDPTRDLKGTIDACQGTPTVRAALGPDHVVPLAPQAVAILRDLPPLTGAGTCVFRTR